MICVCKRFSMSWTYFSPFSWCVCLFLFGCPIFLFVKPSAWDCKISVLELSYLCNSSEVFPACFIFFKNVSASNCRGGRKKWTSNPGFSRCRVLECTSCVMRYELSRRLFAERRACKFNGTPDDFLKRLQLLGVSWDRCVGHWVGAFNGDLWDQMAAFDPTNTYTQAGMFAPCVSWQRRKQWRGEKKTERDREHCSSSNIPLVW